MLRKRIVYLPLCLTLESHIDTIVIVTIDAIFPSNCDNVQAILLLLLMASYSLLFSAENKKKTNNGTNCSSV